MSENKPFNQLTDAQAERLAILAEECAEVIQIVGKILRHGYISTHPDDPNGPDNQEMLEKELGHVDAICVMMGSAKDIDRVTMFQHSAKKAMTILPYLHHNGR